MSLKTYLERIKYIDNLIRRKATGDLESLARKLNLSKSHTALFLSEMKKNGFPIKYSRNSGCYYYFEQGRIVENLFEKDFDTYENRITEEEMKKLTGGKSIFLSIRSFSLKFQ